MRKINAITTVGILVLFIIHGIGGAMLLTGTGQNSFKPLAYIALALIVLHIILSVILTVAAFKAWRKTGTSYFKENMLFWARRISGAAVIVLLMFHFGAFGTMVDSVFRLLPFTTSKLVLQLLMVASIAVHVISNVKPALLSFGIKGLKSRTAEVIIIISVVLLALSVAFVIYWINWNV